jgi:small lipoprotein (TIGR04452 family)
MVIKQEVNEFMKKILGLMIVLFTVSNCLLFDTINITYPWNGVIKGDQAKDQIFTSALIGVVAEIDRNNSDDIIAILAPQLSGINDNRYYLKEDIDECANDALLINLITLDIGGFTCNARERKILVDPIL